MLRMTPLASAIVALLIGIEAYAAEGKQPVAARQSIRTSVGVHSELHQGIGPQQPMTLVLIKIFGF